MGSSYGMTHVGLVRSNNEDFYVSKPELGLYVVADGMGGAKAGELGPSRITVETVVSEMERDGQTVNLASLTEAIRLANKNVRWEADRNRQKCRHGNNDRCGACQRDQGIYRKRRGQPRLSSDGRRTLLRYYGPHLDQRDRQGPRA